MKYEPRLKYYLTTRGLNADGQILSLEYFPKWFHKYVTVVSAATNKTIIQEKYPNVKYWANPPEINTATKKRAWLMRNAKDDFFFINDEIRVFAHIGEGRVKPARDVPEVFRQEIKNLEDLTLYYDGVSTHARLFSNGLQKTTEKLRKNYLPGIIFYWNRKIFAKLKQERVEFGDFIDYLMQTLKLGRRTCNYAGIVYDHKSTKMQRQHKDRTVKIQERDTDRLVKFHPESISRKEDWDELTEVMSVNCKPSKAYKPREVISILYNKKSASLALAFAIILMKHRHDIEVLCLGVNDSPELDDPKTREELEDLGYPTLGLNKTKFSMRHVNRSTYVLTTFNLKESDFYSKLKGVSIITIPNKPLPVLQRGVKKFAMEI